MVKLDRYPCCNETLEKTSSKYFSSPEYCNVQFNFGLSPIGLSEILEASMPVYAEINAGIKTD